MDGEEMFNVAIIRIKGVAEQLTKHKAVPLLWKRTNLFCWW